MHALQLRCCNADLDLPWYTTRWDVGRSRRGHAHVSNAAFGVLTGGLAICQLLDKQLGLSGEKAINFHTWKIQVYNIYILYIPWEPTQPSFLGVISYNPYFGEVENRHFVHGLFLGPRDVFPGGGAAPSTFLGSTTSLRSNAKCHGDTWAKCLRTKGRRSSTGDFFVVWLEGFLLGGGKTW